jgi:hypothetical protein
MNKKDQDKLDRCIAGRVLESRLHPYRLPLVPGDSITIDVEFGDEGDHSWTRCEAEVQLRHLVMADDYQERLP